MNNAVSRRRPRPASPLPSSTAVLALLAAAAYLPANPGSGALLGLLPSAPFAAAQCVNACHGHGECNVEGMCDCHPDWDTPFCSVRGPCPSGPSWAAVASADDAAHPTAECSAVGYCNGDTGVCDCATGFHGLACEQQACPNDCSGQGRCLSMGDASAALDGFHLNRSMQYAGWDRGILSGCVCDPGFFGADCSRRVCPAGHNPQLTSGTHELANVFCQCPDATCNGVLRVSLGGSLLSDRLPVATLDGDGLAAAVMGLSTVASNTGVYPVVPVAVVGTGTDLVCTVAGASTQLSFNVDDGDVPPLLLNATGHDAGFSARMETKLTLSCTCGATCGGSFVLEFDGHATPELPFDSTPAGIATALGLLGNLEAVVSVDGAVPADAISVGPTADAGALCTSSGTGRSMEIVLRAPFGNLPALTAYPSLTSNGAPAAASVVTVASQDGTEVRVPCNGLGSCDEAFGTCSCHEGYTQTKTGHCSKFMYNASGWTGLERCPGMRKQSDGSAVGRVNFQYFYFSDNGNTNTSNTLSAQATSNKTFAEGIFRFGGLQAPGPTQVLLANNTKNGDSGAGVALDLGARKFYWLDRTLQVVNYHHHFEVLHGNLTQRKAKEGTFLNAGHGITTTMTGMALDLRYAKRTMYLCDPGEKGTVDGKIYMTNLDDASPTLVDLTPNIGQSILRDPQGLAIDLDHEYLYWTDSGATRGVALADGFVYRSKLDGTDAEVVISGKANTGVATDPALIDPFSIAIDTKNRTLYIGDYGAKTIYKAGADFQRSDAAAALWGLSYFGPYVRLVPANGAPVAPQRPHALVLDHIGNRLYFTDETLALIAGVALTGHDPATSQASVVVAFGGTSSPRGLAFDAAGGAPYKRLGAPNGEAYTNCNGRGTCLGHAGEFLCKCDEGFRGASCDHASCPRGLAWFDDAGHSNMVECSAAGHCDATTGKCVCAPGYYGGACQHMRCPMGLASELHPAGQECSGRGQCRTLRELAGKAVDAKGVPVALEYGTPAATLGGTMAAWDADRVMACDCDSYDDGTSAFFTDSFYGHDCSRRRCPLGDDSRTYNVNSTFEVQRVKCTALGVAAVGSGTFALTWRGQATAAIAYAATNAELEAALEALPNLHDVKVSGALCDGTAGGAEVKFLSDLGNLPLLTSSVPADVSVEVLIDGTKENAECSNHGLCNHATGVCECFPDHYSSDGDGNIGLRADCGLEEYHGQQIIYVRRDGAGPGERAKNKRKSVV